MKRANSPFLFTVGRMHLLATFGRLLLCLLISIGIGPIIGCETDIEDLSGKNLIICWVTSDTEILNTQQVAHLRAMVEYSGKDSELLYDWSAPEGEIHSNGTYATYIAPEKCGTYNIIFKVYNGGITVSEAVTVEVVEPAESDKPCNDSKADETASPDDPGANKSPEQTESPKK